MLAALWRCYACSRGCTSICTHTHVYGSTSGGRSRQSTGICVFPYAIVPSALGRVHPDTVSALDPGRPTDSLPHESGGERGRRPISGAKSADPGSHEAWRCVIVRGPSNGQPRYALGSTSPTTRFVHHRPHARYAHGRRHGLPTHARQLFLSPQPLHPRPPVCACGVCLWGKKVLVRRVVRKLVISVPLPPGMW